MTRRSVWVKLWRLIWGGYRAGGLCGLWHFVRCHTWHRYHVVNVSGMEGYDWGWLDADAKLELAMWRVLCDFVEQEQQDTGLLGTVDEVWPNHNPDERAMLENQLRDDREIRALYDWWKHERPRKAAVVDELLVKSDALGYQPYWDAEQALEAEKTEMLCSLVRVRGRMWT